MAIPVALPVIADIAGLASAGLTIGRNIRERWGISHEPPNTTFPTGGGINSYVPRRKRASSWIPITTSEKIRDYFNSSTLPDFPSVSGDMRLY